MAQNKLTVISWRRINNICYVDFLVAKSQVFVWKSLRANAS